jgi:hypothetical protein
LCFPPKCKTSQFFDRNWFGEAGRKVPINPEGFVPLKELVIYLLEIKNGKDKKILTK